MPKKPKKVAIVMDQKNTDIIIELTNICNIHVLNIEFRFVCHRYFYYIQSTTYNNL